MRILAVGGGSGGHVTPVVAVLRELKARDSSTEIRFWCDRKFEKQARSIIDHFDATIPVQTIYAGKLRRYNNLPLWRQLLRPVSIVLPNLRDFLLVGLGFIQSLTKLVFWRPDAVFTKGGFVCLPVGLAAHLLKIPLVIHDSDAHPGLTNRILARWAQAIATGAPLEYYPYPRSKTQYVGIPIAPEFHVFSPEERREAKRSLGVDETRPLVVVTGGGLGAQRINNATVAVLDELLAVTSVILISGVGQYEELRNKTPNNDRRFQLHAFVSDGMARMLGAADVVITRAGATTILELAALAAPTILVPNAFLTGGHQLKNAAVYADKQAVELILEDDMLADPQYLTRSVSSLLYDEARRRALSVAIHEFARPAAAKTMAEMIIGAVK
jgi:UDP-N-acetylglucosamine--N-acetylmuramyl-(pentapeptide) pyrophosphoryl-undecaprenol N-acetylglucosamine transferase